MPRSPQPEEHPFGEIRGDEYWNGQEWRPKDEMDASLPKSEDFPCPACGSPMDANGFCTNKDCETLQ